MLGLKLRMWVEHSSVIQSYIIYSWIKKKNKFWLSLVNFKGARIFMLQH